MSPLEQQIRNKIEAVGVPLKEWDVRIYRGVLTGLNKAFIINSATKDALIAADPKSAEIIRPILRGRDIKKYSYDFANLWLICTQSGNAEVAAIDIENYPAIKEHLDRYFPDLKKRYDQGITPYHLRSCAYMDDFYKQKIAWGNLCLHSQFAMVTEDLFVNNPANIIVPCDKYLLGVLNSKLADFYIRSLGVTRNGGYFEYKPMFVEKLPVPILTTEEKEPFVAIVDTILAAKKAGEDISCLENKLDNLIFSLYKLSDREITFLLSYNNLQ